MDADVVVVGAGPAGSATALRLAQRGHRVLVLDRARFPRSKPCGEYLNPGAVDALSRLGVGDDVARSGVSISGMYVAGPDGARLWAPFPRGRGLLVPRERLDDLLRLAAIHAGAAMLEECHVEGVVPGSPVRVTGRVAGGPMEASARLVVGADGIRSAVARRGGPLAAPRSAHYTIGARFEGLAVDGARGDLHLGWGCYAGAACYGRGRGNVVVAVPRDTLRRWARDAESAFYDAVGGLPALAPMLAGARRITPLVSVGPLGYTRRAPAGDGVMLVGDAAGTIDPMTGQGLALALRGAEIAAAAADRALRGHDTLQHALASYERARAELFRGTWTISRVLQWVIRRPRVAARLFHGLARDPSLASRLLGVVADTRPVRDVVNAGYLIRLIAHASGPSHPYRRAV